MEKDDEKGEDPQKEINLEDKTGAAPKGSHTLEVKDKDGKTYRAYLKTPDRTTKEMALGFSAPIIGQPQYIRAGEILLLGCWLGGDEEIKTDEYLLAGAAMSAMGLLDIAEAELKKN